MSGEFLIRVGAAALVVILIHAMFDPNWMSGYAAGAIATYILFGGPVRGVE